jgi:IclR family pca regulon transcriptional regulator
MSGNKDSNQRPRDFVGAVAHVMDVLQAFDAESSKMTLSDISKRTGLDRAGARRYLLSLEYLGYIKRNDKIFSLSPKILKLGYSYMATIPLSRIAQEILLEITEKTGETSALAILDGLYVVHISKADSRKRLGLNVTIGRRFPALDTSTGRVFMAFMPSEELQIMVEKLGATTISDWNKQHKVDLGEELEKIRKQGYAIVDQEVEE